MRKAALCLFALVLFGCLEKQQPSAADECVALCKAFKGDLSSGPCLSNDYFPDYVCDVAHVPRSPVDDDPANQCPAFGVNASHFVEVNEACSVVRAA